jgi:hypothetical protein
MEYEVPFTDCTIALEPPVVRWMHRPHARDTDCPSCQVELRAAYVASSAVVPLPSASPTGTIDAFGNLFQDDERSSLKTVTTGINGTTVLETSLQCERGTTALGVYANALPCIGMQAVSEVVRTAGKG